MLKKNLSVFAGLMLIGLMIAGFLFLLKIGWQATRDLNETQKTLFVITLTLMAPIFSSYLSTKQLKNKEFELRNREKKEIAYDTFVEILYEYISDPNPNKKPQQ